MNHNLFAYSGVKPLPLTPKPSCIILIEPLADFENICVVVGIVHENCEFLIGFSVFRLKNKFSVSISQHKILH